MKNKKIISRLEGGLGNQMFQYAFAKAFSLRNKANFYLDKTSGFDFDIYKRVYLLYQFSGPTKVDENIGLYQLYKNRYIRKLFRMLNNSLGLNMILQEKNIHTYNKIYLLSQNLLLVLEGYWQSPKYFSEYIEIIKKDFEIVETMEEATLEEAELINSCKITTALCFRFFQEVENADMDFQKKALYYNKAIGKIENNLTEQKFVVFCNDVTMAKEFIQNYLSLNHSNVIYISEKSENERAVQDLYLLKLCNNYILSASTLHWWGAFLSHNPNKIITQKNYVNNDIIQDEWEVVNLNE
ncbi:MAG: hypothetical protein GQ570_01490 [Helicobacteraceae bacterium]|nr:hypothetical protein [Helicobacteraceae bacterium]